MLRSYKFTVWHVVIVYALIRALSFITYGHETTNQIIAAALLAAFVFTAAKKLPLAWLALLAELLLDGSGHFFTLGGFLLRTWFLGIFAAAWLYKKIKSRKQKIVRIQTLLTAPFICLALFGLVLLFAIVNGYIHDHALKNIFQDAVLYLFLLLLFPALELQKDAGAPAAKIVQGFIVGSAAFSAVTFFIYGSGLGSLPDIYYHWFRNVASGKITDLGNHFFRVVLPEHLLIVPALLVLAALLMKNPKAKRLWFLTLCSALVIALNFSRIYFLGLAVGLLVLAYRENLRRWFTVSSTISVCIFLIFISASWLASRGETFGLPLLGLRFQAVEAPAEDISAAIRLALLPDIKRQIKQRPWLGSGLGATVTYVNPITNQLETRTQFDWGYLEQVAELGLLGAMVFLTLVILILREVARLAHINGIDKAVYPALYATGNTITAGLDNSRSLCRGLLAGGVALFAINITTPALFQGFGILFLSAVWMTSLDSYTIRH